MLFFVVVVQNLQKVPMFLLLGFIFILDCFGDFSGSFTN